MTEREGEWWRGCIGDHTGVFPSNYVKPRELSVSQTVIPATAFQSLGLSVGKGDKISDT